jgi:hypothetical protein
MALDKGIDCPKPDVLKFHRAFLRNMARGGRMYELGLMAEYNMVRMKPFSNMALAPKMMLTRRLSFLLPPKRVKGFRGWIKKIWQRKNPK